MHDDDGTDANDGGPSGANGPEREADGASRAATASGVGERYEEGDGRPASRSSRRRQFLKTLSVPPFAAALAGCESIGDDLLKDGAPTGVPDDGGRSELAAVVEFGESFAVDVVASSVAGGETRLTGRVDRGDYYLRVEREDAATELYVVDGTGYVLDDDRCLEYPDVTARQEVQADSREGGEYEAPTSPSVAPTGTTTVDGREVRAFERSAAGPDGSGEALTYYVDSETGYLRRIETESTVVDFRSWGDVEPVEAPDVECQQMEGPSLPTGTPTPTDAPSGTATATPDREASGTGGPDDGAATGDETAGE